VKTALGLFSKVFYEPMCDTYFLGMLHYTPTALIHNRGFWKLCIDLLTNTVTMVHVGEEVDTELPKLTVMMARSS
jgi:hypothetical protein